MKKCLISTAVAVAIAGSTVPMQVMAKSHGSNAGYQGDDRRTGHHHDRRRPDKGDGTYIASIDIDGESKDGETLRGFVFDDRNRNGNFDRGERGIRNVMVSNGLDVVLTDNRGRYQFDASAYREDMNIFVSKPDCYQLPVDDNHVPQFAYIHKEHGSANDLVFGGMPATGKLPARINFPMIRSRCKNEFTVAISGDPQPYSNIEIGYVRDTLAKELADRDDIEAVIVEGDVMGDDLGLLPRFINNLSAAESPQYFVLGNHDLDYDANSDADSSDSFRRTWGPNYYSFTVGKVHFVVLDNVQYPCDSTAPDGSIDPLGRWDFCQDGKTYNGRITEMQLQWLENDLANVPKEQLIVINYHIPTVSFVDQYAAKHSEDTVRRLYEILGYYWDGIQWTKGRPALALSGHTHTNEQFRPGEEFEGWSQASHDFPMPFPQIVAGAAAGSWWSGDFNDEQIPESYQRLGAPKGYYLLHFRGNTYRDEFKASGKAVEKQMSLSFNSPDFRTWFDEIKAWVDNGADGTPPVNSNDLGDNKMLKPSDLDSDQTKLIINVWNGSRDSEVWVKFDDRKPIAAVRTQRGKGEGFVGTLDPFALRRQMNVLRFALKSTKSDQNEIWNGDLGDRSDGFELFSAAAFKADSQRPSDSWMWTVNSNHVWSIAVPDNLDEGVHRVEVHTTDMHGNTYRESMLFEVRTPNSSEDPADNDPTDEKYDRQIPSEL